MKVKSPILLSIISLIILILILDIVYSATSNPYQTDNLTSPHMYTDEICSYQGSININASNATWVNCTCKDGFDNEKTPQIINGVPVQCGYIKKRRFMALFLAVFVPVGIEHFYMENYHLALFSLLLCCTSCIGNCFRFAFPSEKAKVSYFSDNINKVFIILIGCFLIWWILNIILISTGIILDGHKFKTYNDISINI